MNTPRKEKIKQVVTSTNQTRGLIDSKGEKRKQAASNVKVLSKPRTTPINVFPMIIEKKLTGDINVSSKHL